MAWTVIDDFETGVLDANWEGGSLAEWIINSSSPIEGSYDLRIATDAPLGTNIIFRTDSLAQTSRNDNDDYTVRAKMTIADAGIDDSAEGFLFFLTDALNYYEIGFWDKDGKVSLRRYVGGGIVTLATQNISMSMPQAVSFIVKATLTNLDIYVYSDHTYTNLIATLSTTDTQYSSGGIGVKVSRGYSQGPYWDGIEKFEAGAPAAEISKVKIAGSFSSKPVFVKIGGTFVEKTMKVKVGGVFQ